VKLDLMAFMKICKENTKLIKMGHNRALYMKTKVFFFMDGNIKTP
jgi:hypothetical protein